MKKNLVILFLIFSLFELNSQIRVMFFDYQNSFFNYGDPLPAEDVFHIQGVTLDGSEIVRVKFLDSDTKKTIYTSKWKNICGEIPCPLFNIPVYVNLSENDNYDVQIDYFRKSDTNKIVKVDSIIVNRLASYIELNYKIELITSQKKNVDLLNDLNDFVLDALNPYCSYKDVEFSGFSSRISKIITELTDKEVIENETLFNDKKQALINECTFELKNQLTLEFYVLMDNKYMYAYPTENVKKSVLMNLGYGAIITQDFSFSTTPYAGFAIPISSKPILNKFSFNAGIFLTNFHNTGGEVLSGPFIRRPIYIGGGYSFTEYTQFTLGATITQNTTLNNGAFDFNNIGFSVHAGIALNINVIAGLGTKKLKVQKKLPKHQYAVPVLTLDKVCAGKQAGIPDTVEIIKIKFEPQIIDSSAYFVSSDTIRIQDTLLNESVFFDLNSFVVDENSKNGIKSLIDNLDEKKQYLFVVVGFADLTGTIEQNLELSKNRAEKVRNILIEFGVNPDDIQIRYYGSLKTDEYDKARKAELMIMEI